MIPIGPGDLGAIVKAIGFGIEEYRRERTGKLLHDWAELMVQGEPADKDEANKRAIAIRQFAQDRTQERGFTPWYDGTESILIPKDLLTDIMDLLIDTTEPMKNIATKFIDAARRAVGFKSVADKDRATWASLIQAREPAAILTFLESQVTRRGRTRVYSDLPSEGMDIDWIADVGMFLING